jgi:hypothetical protein
MATKEIGFYWSINYFTRMRGRRLSDEIDGEK